MPLCVCGTVLTDIRGADEQVRWAERLGDCWGYRENGTAYWFKCFRCLVREWPNDFKVKNRYSRPAPSWLHLHWTARPRGQLASGDFFFLTTPPPERRGRQHPRCVDAVPAVVFRVFAPLVHLIFLAQNHPGGAPQRLKYNWPPAHASSRACWDAPLSDTTGTPRPCPSQPPVWPQKPLQPTAGRPKSPPSPNQT